MIDIVGKSRMREREGKRRRERGREKRRTCSNRGWMGEKV